MLQLLLLLLLLLLVPVFIGVYNVVSSIMRGDEKKKLKLLHYIIDAPADIDKSTTMLQPVFMIHGWPDNQEVYQLLKDHMVSKSKYAVIRVSLPNYEDRPEQEKPFLGYTLEEGAELFEKTINKVLDEEKEYLFDRSNVAIVCHDWGCIHTYITLANNPTIAKRVIALDVGVPPNTLTFAAFSLAYQTPLVISHYLGTDFIVRFIANGMKWRHYPGGPTPNSRMSWTYVDMLRQAFTRGPSPKKIRTFVPHSDVEFLFVYGEKMPEKLRFFSPKWKEKVLAANPSKNKFVGVQGDHWFVIKNPQPFFEELDKFMEP